VSKQRYTGGGGNARTYFADGLTAFMTESGLITPGQDDYNYYGNNVPDIFDRLSIPSGSQYATSSYGANVNFDQAPDLLHMAGVHASIAEEAMQKASGTRHPPLECW
jgi:hypothetical protein